MNVKRQSYPSILGAYTPYESKHRAKKKGRCFSNAMMRAIAHEESKQANTARFKCPGCNTFFALYYSKWMRNTEHPFAPPTNVCRQCAKDSKYQKA